MGTYKIQTDHGHPSVFHFTRFYQIINSVSIRARVVTSCHGFYGLGLGQDRCGGQDEMSVGRPGSNK